MRQLLILPALLLAACGGGASYASDGDDPGIAPTGSGNQRSYAANGFARIGLSGPDGATVRVGPGFSVTAEGDPAVLERLVVKVKDNRLLLGRKRNWGGGDAGSNRGTARFTVTLPRLSGVSVAGSGDVTVDKAEADEFRAAIAGSGNLAVAALRTKTLSASIAGSGDFTAGGTAEALSASVAGSGNIEAPGLTATSADVSIAGSGNVRARVNGDAKVSIVGSGDAELGPGARCTVSKVGSGSARCG